MQGDWQLGKVAATRESVLDQEKDRQHTPTPPRADAQPSQGRCHVSDATSLPIAPRGHRTARSIQGPVVSALYQLRLPLLPVCDT